MDVRLSWLITGGVAILLIWLAISSVGGGGQPSAPAASSPGAPPPAGATQVADRSSIEQLLTRTLTQNTPGQCTDNMTPRFERQRWGSEKGTFDRCRRANTPQAETTADAVELLSVSGEGGRATAVIKTTSSNLLDGSILSVELVHDGHRWKLDRLIDVQIDRTRLDQHVREELGARGYLPSETSCAVTKFDQAVSNGDIERDLVISDASSYGRITSLAASCLSRPTLLRELSQGMTAGLKSRGVSSQVTRCVVDRLTHGVPITRLRHLLAAGERGAEGWWRLGYQAVLACADGGPAGAASSSTT